MEKLLGLEVKFTKTYHSSCLLPNLFKSHLTMSALRKSQLFSVFLTFTYPFIYLRFVTQVKYKRRNYVVFD